MHQFKIGDRVVTLKFQSGDGAAFPKVMEHLVGKTGNITDFTIGQYGKDLALVHDWWWPVTHIRKAKRGPETFRKP